MPMRAGRASPCTTAAPPLRASGTRQKFGDRLKLERLVRFECGLLGGMRRWYVHAAVFFDGVAKKMRLFYSCRDPPYVQVQVRGRVGKSGHVRTAESLKSQTVPPVVPLNTSSTSLQTSRGYKHVTVDKQLLEAIFS